MIKHDLIVLVVLPVNAAVLIVSIDSDSLSLGINTPVQVQCFNSQTSQLLPFCPQDFLCLAVINGKKRTMRHARQMQRAVKRMSFRLKAFLNLAEVVAASGPASNEKKEKLLIISSHSAKKGGT